MRTNPQPATLLQTQAARRLLEAGLPGNVIDDLVFLEAWERDPAPGPAAARRIAQIRRGQPALAAAIRSELATLSRQSNCHGNATPTRGRVG